MGRNKAVKHIILVLFTLLISSTIVSADSDSPWDGVIDADGNVVAADHGTISMEESWMPSFPIVGDVPAQYHVYQAESGVTVLQPDITTLFFMAMNPKESGLYDAIAQMSTGGALKTEMFGMVIGGEISPKAVITLIIQNISGLDASFTQELADAALQGEDAWSLINFNDTLEIMSHLFDDSFKDSLNQDWRIYLSMLLYPDCAASPVGCLPGMTQADDEDGDDQNDETDTNPPQLPQCQAPQIILGEIIPDATQVAPNYVIVTGQDETKRGVDLCFSLEVLPTIYHVWQLEFSGSNESCGVEIGPWWQNRIDRGDATLADACPAEHYTVQPDFRCVEKVYLLPEGIISALGKASLTTTSRAWILEELSVSYPGAHLIQPDWSFLTFQGIGTSHWEVCQNNIQIRDPGDYDLQVCYETSGTSVSDGRSGCVTLQQLPVYLIQTTIIW